MPHHFAFRLIEARSKQAIDDALLNEPQLARAAYFHTRADRLTGKAAWDVLKAYLDAIEEAMAKIIRGHSVLFWFWVYRRIAVYLHPGHDNKTDAVTTQLVRSTLEAAFMKYGDLGNHGDLIVPCDNPGVPIMGGLVEEYLRTTAFSASFVRDYLRALRERPHLCPGHFSDNDLVDVYRLEGMAYEYWLTCAHMRSIGKGAELSFDRGHPHAARDSDLEWLIQNYDGRTENEGFSATSIGVAFRNAPSSGNTALFVQYNVKQESMTAEMASFLSCVIDGVPNFSVVAMSLADFVASHAFADPSLFKARGYRLSTACAVVQSMVMVELFEAGRVNGDKSSQVLQRGYVVKEPHWHRERLIAMAREYGRVWGMVMEDSFEEEANAFLDSVTLDIQAQARMSLWTHGPIMLFVPYGEVVEMENLEPVLMLVNDLFIGVKYPANGKGTAFEDAFRDWIGRAGLGLLPQRHLRIGESAREVDAAVRVNDTLYLCECRAMEKPLDLRLSKPEKLARRNQDMLDKLEQAETLAKLVRDSPRGDNYDFSWAADVVHVVVSPFCEWIWSRDARLWIDESTPRVLSAVEAVRLMQKQRTEQVEVETS